MFARRQISGCWGLLAVSTLTEAPSPLQVVLILPNNRNQIRIAAEGRNYPDWQWFIFGFLNWLTPIEVALGVENFSTDVINHAVRVSCIFERSLELLKPDFQAFLGVYYSSQAYALAVHNPTVNMVGMCTAEVEVVS